MANFIDVYNNVDELPKQIKLEACSICQLDCTVCYMRKAYKEDSQHKLKKLGYLKFENFRKVVDDFQFYRIELSNSGEIFLNPELDEIIKYGYEKNIELNASNGTNLNYLPDKTAENLVKYKFNFLELSIDGASQETYSIYRRNGDFNKVIDNIKKINRFKEKYNSEYPKILYKFIVFGHNEHEILKAKQLAKDLNVDIRFDINYDPNYSPIIDKEMVLKNTGWPTTDMYELLKIRNYINCKDIFNFPQFDYDGELLGCCCNQFVGLGGNLFRDGYLNAMNHQKVVNLRKFLLGFPIEEDFDYHCFHCDMLQLFTPY